MILVRNHEKFKSIQADYLWLEHSQGMVKSKSSYFPGFANREHTVNDTMDIFDMHWRSVLSKLIDLR